MIICRMWVTKWKIGNTSSEYKLSQIKLEVFKSPPYQHCYGSVLLYATEW